MLKKALYPGTFDPLTNGHLDILERSLKIFDEVTIVVAISPKKKPLFSEEERVQMLKELFKDRPQITVDSWSGLIIDYAKEKKIGVLIRGLRPTGDFEMEFQMASMNNNLNPDLETIFLVTEGQNYYVSSSLVKEVFLHGGSIHDFVPPIVVQKLKGKVK